jgi:hypothetical protein
MVWLAKWQDFASGETHHRRTAMARHQVTRRTLLGAFAVVLALPGLQAAAFTEGPVMGPMDFGSRQDFEDYCENSGKRRR